MVERVSSGPVDIVTYPWEIPTESTVSYFDETGTRVLVARESPKESTAAGGELVHLLRSKCNHRTSRRSTHLLVQHQNQAVLTMHDLLAVGECKILALHQLGIFGMRGDKAC